MNILETKTFHVKNFGCRPDGRFLRRANIDAGSQVLIDMDNSLSPTVVGKLIAIPGAADLETKIARLLDRQEVKQAKMTQGSAELTGTLISLNEKNEEVIEKFRQKHVGRRITVAGAGPNGKTLVTDIVQVNQDGKRIVLADQASKTVSGTEVILNRSEQVALEDYARRSGSFLTVQLNGRIITDAKMIIGGRALFSETAKFSSLDLDTKVVIPGAGLLLTSIESFTNSSRVTLAKTADRTVDEGQADIWKKALESDSRPGLEKLLAYIDKNKKKIKAARIVFDPGVYDFTRMEDDPGPLNAAIGLLGKMNITFQGGGPTVTALRLRPSQDLTAATHMIETIDCRNITFRDLAILGSYLTMFKAGEQLHGITINEGSQNIKIENVQVFQTGGDGIRFLGRAEHPDQNQPEKKVRNVTVRNCHLIQNKRSGLAFQRKVEKVKVQNCYIKMTPPSTDSCVDMEPTGNQNPGVIFVSPTDIVIDSCIMTHDTPAPAVALSGFGSKDLAQNIKFINNKIYGGHIYCSDIKELTIQNNTILMPYGGLRRVPIYLGPSCQIVVIANNELVNDHPDARSVILTEGKRKAHNVIISKNNCFTQAGTGIQCLSGDEITIEENKVFARGACNSGIKISAQSIDMDHISIRKNEVRGEGAGRWKFGILLSAQSNCISNLTLDGNTISEADKETVFLGTKFC